MAEQRGKYYTPNTRKVLPNARQALRNRMTAGSRNYVHQLRQTEKQPASTGVSNSPV